MFIKNKKDYSSASTDEELLKEKLLGFVNRPNKKYIIIMSTTDVKLADAVCEKMEQGYHPCGNVSCTTSGYYMQSMVLT
jgi:hypothetical protein